MAWLSIQFSRKATALAKIQNLISSTIAQSIGYTNNCGKIDASEAILALQHNDLTNNNVVEPIRRVPQIEHFEMIDSHCSTELSLLKY